MKVKLTLVKTKLRRQPKDESNVGALTFLREYASMDGCDDTNIVELLAAWLDENEDIYDRLVEHLVGPD